MRRTRVARIDGTRRSPTLAAGDASAVPRRCRLEDAVCWIVPCALCRVKLLRQGGKGAGETPKAPYPWIYANANVVWNGQDVKLKSLGPSRFALHSVSSSIVSSGI